MFTPQRQYPTDTTGYTRKKVTPRHTAATPTPDTVPDYNAIDSDMAHFRSPALKIALACIAAGAEYGLVGYCQQASRNDLLPLIVEQLGTLAQDGAPLYVQTDLQPSCQVLFTRLYHTLLTCHDCTVAEIAVNSWAHALKDGSAQRLNLTDGNWPQYVLASVQRLLLVCHDTWNDDGVYFGAAQVYVLQEDAQAEHDAAVKRHWHGMRGWQSRADKRGYSVPTFQTNERRRKPRASK